MDTSHSGSSCFEGTNHRDGPTEHKKQTIAKYKRPWLGVSFSRRWEKTSLTKAQVIHILKRAHRMLAPRRGDPCRLRPPRKPSAKQWRNGYVAQAVFKSSVCDFDFIIFLFIVVHRIILWLMSVGLGTKEASYYREALALQNWTSTMRHDEDWCGRFLVCFQEYGEPWGVQGIMYL